MHFPAKYCALDCKCINWWINYVSVLLFTSTLYFNSLWEMQPRVKNGSNKTSNLHRLVRSHKEESICYNFWWWCYSSKKKGYFCPFFIGGLCFMRSTQGRCPGQTPDWPFQYPWGPSPPRAAWSKFESCTRSLSCPTRHLISGEKKAR